MLKKYTPPYLSILFIISIINIIFSTYFISFFLAGVVFKIFSISIKKGYNYILIFSIITFLVIENTQGVSLFSLTLISLCVYYLIIPRVKHLFSSVLILDFIFIFCFYIIFYLLVQLYSVFDLSVLMTFFVNFFIDILIIGLIL